MAVSSVSTNVSSMLKNIDSLTPSEINDMIKLLSQKATKTSKPLIHELENVMNGVREKLSKIPTLVDGFPNPKFSITFTLCNHTLQKIGDRVGQFMKHLEFGSTERKILYCGTQINSANSIVILEMAKLFAEFDWNMLREFKSSPRGNDISYVDDINFSNGKVLSNFINEMDVILKMNHSIDTNGKFKVFKDGVFSQLKSQYDRTEIRKKLIDAGCYYLSDDEINENTSGNEMFKRIFIAKSIKGEMDDNEFSEWMCDPNVLMGIYDMVVFDISKKIKNDIVVIDENKSVGDKIVFSNNGDRMIIQCCAVIEIFKNISSLNKAKKYYVVSNVNIF